MLDWIGIVIVLLLLLVVLSRWRLQTGTGKSEDRYGRTLRFHGTGEMTVRAPGLIASQYRLDYQFPENVLVKVDLLDTATGERELIVLKRGAGVAGFDVTHPGDYLLHVAPLDDTAEWQLTMRPGGSGNKMGRTD
jgi:hypothetical protein